MCRDREGVPLLDSATTSNGSKRAVPAGPLAPAPGTRWGPIPCRENLRCDHAVSAQRNNRPLQLHQNCGGPFANHNSFRSSRVFANRLLDRLQLWRLQRGQPMSHGCYIMRYPRRTAPWSKTALLQNSAAETNCVTLKSRREPSPHPVPSTRQNHGIERSEIEPRFQQTGRSRWLDPEYC